MFLNELSLSSLSSLRSLALWKPLVLVNPEKGLEKTAFTELVTMISSTPINIKYSFIIFNMKLYLHSGNSVEIYESKEGETIEQLQKVIGSEIKLNNRYLTDSWIFRTIMNTSMLVSSFFDDGSDVIVEKIKPIPI